MAVTLPFLTSYDPPDYPGSELRRGKGMKVGDAGFDEYSLWHTGHTELKGPRYADPVILENGKFRKDLKGRYGEDVWVEFIRKFMKRCKKSGKPFFVYYPMALPHWPFVPTPRSGDWGIQEKMHPPLGTSGGDTKYFPDMVACGDSVVSVKINSPNGITWNPGTSFAAPMVAGTALVIRSAMPSYSALDTKAVVLPSSPSTAESGDKANKIPC